LSNCQFCPLDSRQWQATRPAGIEQEAATVVGGLDVAKLSFGPVESSPSGFQLKLMKKCLICAQKTFKFKSHSPSIVAMSYFGFLIFDFFHFSKSCT